MASLPFPLSRRRSILLQPPKRWTSEHLRILKIIQQYNLPAEVIVGPGYLPHDGDEDFERLAADFIEPTKPDLTHHFATSRSKYRRNIFHPIFLRLNEVAGPRGHAGTSKYAMSNLLEVLLSNLEDKHNLKTIPGPKIPFEIKSCGVSGNLRCEGALIKADAVPGATSVPLATFSQVANNQDDASATANEITQVLVQGFLAYEQNPTLNSYTAFVLHTDGTILRLSAAAISRTYIEELYQGMPLSDNLRLLRSELYDLLECDRRREALRLIIGLLESFNSD